MKREDLTPVQEAVLEACQEHFQNSYTPIGGAVWWRARSPFQGGHRAFAAHLRALERKGRLRRVEGGYVLAYREEAKSAV